MGLQLDTPIATARGILNDPSAVRYSAADLLKYANDALDQVAGLLPQVFHTDGTYECTAGTVEQELALDTALALVRVNGVVGGSVVTQADRNVFDAFHTGWRNDTAAAAVNWLAVENAPRKFLIHPKAPVAQVLNVTYVRVPGEYTGSQDTGIPTALADAIADYIVYRAEARDDEHVNSNRATQFLASFIQKVKG